MPRDPKEIQQVNARIAARSDAMSRDVLAILRRYAALLERRALSAARRKRRLPLPRERLEKADSRGKLEAELAKIIEIFGLRQARDAARRVGATDVSQDYVTRIAEQSIFTAKRVLARTDRRMTESVNRVIAEGVRKGETVSEIAKRIREQWHGTEGGRAVDIKESDRTVTTGQTRRLSTQRGVLYWVSAERARTIAETEVGEAEETGKVDGYRALGATHIVWMSRQWAQGRHQSMNGQMIKLSHKYKRIGPKFRYPDGSRGSYPRSSDSPVRHRVNCHCTTRPVYATTDKESKQ